MPSFSLLALARRLAPAFDRSFWIFSALAAVSGAACWWVAGKAAFLDSLGRDLGIIASLLPKLMAAMLVAALIQMLLPRALVARWIGAKSGLKGMTIAAAAGAVTPGGPMTSFPLVSALHAAGSGRSALISYLTSWSLLGFQRIFVWELPLMGLEFAALRFLVSLPLPLVAGLIALLIPVRFETQPAE